MLFMRIGAGPHNYVHAPHFFTLCTVFYCSISNRIIKTRTFFYKYLALYISLWYVICVYIHTHTVTYTHAIVEKRRARRRSSPEVERDGRSGLLFIVNTSGNEKYIIIRTIERVLIASV